MNAVRITAILGFLVTAGIIIYAVIVGDFWAEGAILTSMPWGIVSLVDLYTGFILFAGWIAYREKSLLRSIAWIAPLMVLGFVWACVYIFVVAQSSGGNWQRFWMGRAA